MNPLGLVYKSEAENKLEKQHISQLVNELEENDIDYFMAQDAGFVSNICIFGKYCFDILVFRMSIN